MQQTALYCSGGKSAPRTVAIKMLSTFPFEKGKQEKENDSARVILNAVYRAIAHKLPLLDLVTCRPFFEEDVCAVEKQMGFIFQFWSS
jgi:hypothetical protein